MSKESVESRLKRMKMRSWRRGTKEMDLILGPFADTRLSEMNADALDLFDSLLAENDQDLYPWVTTPGTCPERFRDLIAEISDFARNRHPDPARTGSI